MLVLTNFGDEGQSFPLPILHDMSTKRFQHGLDFLVTTISN